MEYSFVACLMISHLTVDDASLSRQSTEGGYYLLAKAFAFVPGFHRYAAFGSRGRTGCFFSTRKFQRSYFSVMNVRRVFSCTVDLDRLHNRAR